MDLKKQVPLVLIGVAFLAYIILSVVCGGCQKGTDSKRIADLGITIDELQAKNRKLNDLNTGLENRIGELQANNQRLGNTIRALQEATSGAGSDLQDALGTVERLRRIAETLTE